MSAIQQAVSWAGSPSRLAELLGVTPAAISEWTSGRRPVSVRRCVQIESITGGAVTRQELRPDDWPRIWPELAEKHPERAADCMARRAARAAA